MAPLLHILAMGRIGQSEEMAIVKRYLDRLAWPYRISERKKNSKQSWPKPMKASRSVLLDERGHNMTSMQFASTLQSWNEEGAREVRFYLGADDGHDKLEPKQADLTLSLGAMTWPHLLVRAMLAEQIYRAVSIINHHPYHREG